MAMQYVQRILVPITAATVLLFAPLAFVAKKAKGPFADPDVAALRRRGESRGLPANRQARRAKGGCQCAGRGRHDAPCLLHVGGEHERIRAFADSRRRSEPAGQSRRCGHPPRCACAGKGPGVLKLALAQQVRIPTFAPATGLRCQKSPLMACQKSWVILGQRLFSMPSAPTIRRM